MSLCKRTALSAFALMASATASFATDPLEGQVLAVEGPTVRVELSGQAPEWLQKGTVVQAIGWDASVAGIDGKVVSLRFEGSRAEDAKVGGSIAIREIPAEQFSCG